MTLLGIGRKMAKNLDFKRFKEYFNWQYSDAFIDESVVTYEFYFSKITKEILDVVNKSNPNYYIISGCHDLDENGSFKVCLVIEIRGVK